MIVKAILYLLLGVLMLVLTPFLAFFLGMQWTTEGDFKLKDYLAIIAKLFCDTDIAQFEQTFKHEILFFD